MIHRNQDLLKVTGVKGQPIMGILIEKLKTIPDERGYILHMLRCDNPVFERFGEIYFSTVYPGVVKGWHIHKKMTLNYAVPVGMIKLVLYDDRIESASRGNLMEVFMGERNHLRVTIPPGIWNGTKGIGTSMAIIANCADLPHDSNEIDRMDPFSSAIPYQWDLAHG